MTIVKGFDVVYVFPRKIHIRRKIYIDRNHEKKVRHMFNFVY